MPYRQQELPPVAREVVFEDLLPETQARLTAACREPGQCLLGERQEAFPRAVHGLLLSTVAGLGVAAALGWGYGSLSFRDLIERNVQQGVLSGLLGLCALGGALALQAQRRAAGRPLPPGLYLFGRELVDARARRLRLLSTEAIVSISCAGGRLGLSFRDGSRCVFRSATAPADALSRQIEEARLQAELAEDRGDLEAPCGLDPFALERPRWANAPLPASWSRRWRHLALAAVITPASAALLCAAGRGWAIERAAREERFSDLAWFSLTDRWMAGWADRRWRSAALASQSPDALQLYAHISTNRGPLVRQLSDRLRLCPQQPNLGCVQALRALCQASSPPVERMRELIGLLDTRSMRQVMPACQRFFWHHGWSEGHFHGSQLSRAIEQEDVRSLWDLGAHHIRKRLYEQEIGRRELGTTPTARMVTLALRELPFHNQDLVLRVTTGGAQYSSVAEERAYERWRHEAAVLLRKGLESQPFGRLLRLDVRDDDEGSRAELVADLELKPTGTAGKLSLHSITWTLRTPPMSELQPDWDRLFYRGRIDWGHELFFNPAENRQTSFRAPLGKPRQIRHPTQGLPDPDELHLLDALL